MSFQIGRLCQRANVSHVFFQDVQYVIGIEILKKFRKLSLCHKVQQFLLCLELCKHILDLSYTVVHACTSKCDIPMCSLHWLQCTLVALCENDFNFKDGSFDGWLNMQFILCVEPESEATNQVPNFVMLNSPSSDIAAVTQDTQDLQNAYNFSCHESMAQNLDNIKIQMLITWCHPLLCYILRYCAFMLLPLPYLVQI